MPETNGAEIRRRMKLAGLVLMLAALIIFTVVNLPTMREKTFTLDSTYNSKQVRLKASLWEAEGAEYAVLICPGYSCDRQKWRPFADLFVSNGYTTMVFDYAGQGASNSTIGFDNARTDAIPAEIDDALEALHARTGIDYDHIILVGHSMGGRAILRLLCDYNREGAETVTEKKDIAAAILFSPEVNYSFSAQASLFAGTADDVDEPWASYSAQDIAGTDIYLYGSTADDIVSPENILAIYGRLGGENLPVKGVYSDVQVNEAGSRITVGITRGVLHSYQMYSPEFAAFTNEALSDISGNNTAFAPWRMLLIYFGWGFSLAGVGLFLAGLRRGIGDAKVGREAGDTDRVPALLDAKKFLKWKLLMWLPGLVVAFLICCVCVVLPFGSPVMNLPYMCCIAGYGLFMWFMYRKGHFAGTEGKLPPLFGRVKTEQGDSSLRAGKTVSGRSDSGESGSEKTFSEELIGCIFIAALVCLFVWYVLRASMYRLLPLNFRLFWAAFAGFLMTVGYYISGCERDMLDAAGASRRVRLLYSLIQYVALFLLVLFYLVIGSYSGLIGQIQNMVLMYIFCIPLGDFIRERTGNRAAGAFVCGFIFQALMITSSALIAIF